MNLALKRFDQQVDNLLCDLKRIFPANKDIPIAQAQINTYRMVSKTVIIDNFIKFVYPYKQKIMNKDEKFFLEEGNVENGDILEELKIRELWKSQLRPENKKMIWEYFQVMIVLTDKYLESKEKVSCG